MKVVFQVDAETRVTYILRLEVLRRMGPKLFLISKVAMEVVKEELQRWAEFLVRGRGRQAVGYGVV